MLGCGPPLDHAILSAGPAGAPVIVPGPVGWARDRGAAALGLTPPAGSFPVGGGGPPGALGGGRIVVLGAGRASPSDRRARTSRPQPVSRGDRGMVGLGETGAPIFGRGARVPAPGPHRGWIVRWSRMMLSE